MLAPAPARAPLRTGAPQQLVLLLASSLTVMAGAIVAPALPGIGAAFAQEPGIQLLSRLVLTAPALAVVVAAPIAGALADRWGRRPLLHASLVLYGLGGTSGLWVSDLWLLLAGRAVLGVGVAGVMTTAVTLIADYFAGAERGRLMGVQAAFMGFGGLVFLLLGGVLADIGWRAPFAMYLAGWLLLPISWRLLDEPLRPGDASPGNAEPTTANTAQRHAASDAEPTPYVRIGALMVTASLGFILFYMIPVQLPFSLKENLGVSGLGVGLALGTMTLLSSLSSLSFQRVRAVVGNSGALVITFGGIVPGLYLLAVADSYTRVWFALATLGPPLGLLMPNLSTWLSSLAPARVRARCMGGMTMAVFLGQFLSPIATSPFVRRWGLHGVPGAFFAAATASATIAVAALAVAVRGRR